MTIGKQRHVQHIFFLKKICIKGRNMFALGTDTHTIGLFQLKSCLHAQQWICLKPKVAGYAAMYMEKEFIFSGDNDLFFSAV